MSMLRPKLLVNLSVYEIPSLSIYLNAMFHHCVTLQICGTGDSIHHEIKAQNQEARLRQLV
jgi:hypothetical protein